MSISEKLNLIGSWKELAEKFYKDRLTPEMILECRTWIDIRNQLIHHMANLPYDNERVQKVAVEGNELVRKVKSKTTCNN